MICFAWHVMSWLSYVERSYKHEDHNKNDKNDSTSK